MAKELNFKQELVGCFGQPVAENPTQPMVEAAFRHHGLDWRYLTIEVAPSDLAAAVAGVRAMGFRGFNCTIPHKQAVIEHLDELGESAALMQAVNCVVVRDGRLIGENTDGKGFVMGVRRLIEPAGDRVLGRGQGLLGGCVAGGAVGGGAEGGEQLGAQRVREHADRRDEQEEDEEDEEGQQAEPGPVPPRGGGRTDIGAAPDHGGVSIDDETGHVSRVGRLIRRRPPSGPTARQGRPWRQRSVPGSGTTPGRAARPGAGRSES
mgnify:CR=1 FL=1